MDVAHPQTKMAESPELSSKWLDVSVPIYTGMVHFPDNPPIEIDTIMHVERGDICTLSGLKMGVHTGTHIDGPIHFLPHTPGTEAVPLEHLMGPAKVIEIEDSRSVTWAELRKHNIGPSQRLLFKTLNSQRCWNTSEFVSDFVSLAEDAARHLAELKTLAVGIDYLSLGSPEVHRTILGAGVAIIEGLNLSKVTPGEYEFLCLPLSIPGSDGAPARALLKPLPTNDNGLRKEQTPHSAREVFKLHRMQAYEPFLRFVHGTYLFDIDNVGCWFVAVDNGAIHIEETKHDADCTICCDEPDFVDIVEGRRQLITCHMQGRVTIRGDMALAQKFHGLVSAMIQQRGER
jgi:arylformamidase